MAQAAYFHWNGVVSRKGLVFPHSCGRYFLQFRAIAPRPKRSESVVCATEDPFNASVSSIRRAVYQLKFRIRYCIKDRCSEFAQLCRSVVGGTERNVLIQHVIGGHGITFSTSCEFQAAIKLSATRGFFCAAGESATRTTIEAMAKTFFIATSAMRRIVPLEDFLSNVGEPPPADFLQIRRVARILSKEPLFELRP